MARKPLARTQDNVIEQFFKQEPFTASNTESDGKTLWHYHTAILRHHDGAIYFNCTKYSKSTTALQQKVRKKIIPLIDPKNKICVVEDVPLGQYQLEKFKPIDTPVISFIPMFGNNVLLTTTYGLEIKGRVVGATATHVVLRGAKSYSPFILKDFNDEITVHRETIKELREYAKN